jgi:lysozyme
MIKRMRMMTTSNQGKNLIKEAEGLRLDAYRCPAGIPTIGWGHTRGVKLGQHITVQQAEDMLVEDIAPIERLLNGLKINFRQEQFDALVSWIFNFGEGKFKGSTMYKRIIANAKDEEITDQLVKWINAAGRPLLGLMKRRVAEANLFIGYERYKVNKDRIIKV